MAPAATSPTYIFLPTSSNASGPSFVAFWNPRDELTIGSLHIHSVDLIRIRRRHISCVTRRVEVDPRTNVSKSPRMQLCPVKSIPSHDSAAHLAPSDEHGFLATCPRIGHVRGSKHDGQRDSPVFLQAVRCYPEFMQSSPGIQDIKLGARIIAVHDAAAFELSLIQFLSGYAGRRDPRETGSNTAS